MQQGQESDEGYAGQARGGARAYAAYYAGMDKSMQQKVALTTAYFPVRGVLADMGLWLRGGSHDLACLHAGLQVVGVDVAPESVAYAQQHYRRPNLRTACDIAQPSSLPRASTASSTPSVFHHLTSFNDFSLDPVRQALDHQTAALRPAGCSSSATSGVPRGPLDVPL